MWYNSPLKYYIRIASMQVHHIMLQPSVQPLIAGVNVTAFAARTLKNMPQQHATAL